MAILSAIFSLLSRKLGDLLQALFGWSITGLFGRLRAQKQTALSIALILSILWPLLVVGCFAPKVAAWAVAFLPLQQWVGHAVLRAIWIVLAVLSPILVGVITAWVAPSRKQRGGVLRTVLSGFPLTLGLFLSFLLTFFIVPALKLIAMARRWEDEHVYLQVKEGAYGQVLERLAAACDKAGVAVRSEPVPKVMQAPLRVLRFFARSGIEPLVASDPRMLRGDGVELYLYPADLLIRGRTEPTRRIRAAMVREMMEAPAYLAEDPKAQRIEDRITGAFEMIARHRDLGEVGDAARERVREIAAELEAANVPYDDWVILFSALLRLERTANGAPTLIEIQKDGQPALAAQEVAMAEPNTEPRPGADPRPEVSTVQLVKDAVDEAKALFKTEIALARDEAKKQLAAVKVAAISMSIAAVTAILGLALLLVALVLSIFPQPVTALITGGVLLAAAVASGLIGYTMLPKKPMEQTQERLETDAQVLKERIA